MVIALFSSSLASGKREPQFRKRFRHIRLWNSFLTNDCREKVQLLMGGATPGQVVLGKPRRATQSVAFLHGLVFSFYLQVPVLLEFLFWPPSVMGCDLDVQAAQTLSSPDHLWSVP